VIERAIACIEKNIAHDNLSDDRIAQAAGTTTATLIAQFEAFFSISPWEYVMEHRLVFAKALLENTSKPIYEIALDVGMDPKYFSDFFKARMGISATEYRKSLDAE
jgi:AraC-like DNA-binding protein